ncbi:uncharacterized protein TNCV_4277711 [Trichonephila clavipes]|nr:uncharacterized protein TNCV_4277711 [Trichonephila clavipes]
MTCDVKDCGFQMLNDNVIVTSVQDSDSVDDETDEDEDNNNKESSKGPSNPHAFPALETTMEWYEQQSECCPTPLLLLKRVRDLAAKKRSIQWYSEKSFGFGASRQTPVAVWHGRGNRGDVRRKQCAPYTANVRRQMSVLNSPPAIRKRTTVCCSDHLRFDIFELRETKLPVQLINSTKEPILVQGHETPLRVKEDIEVVSSELDNRGLQAALLG